MTQEINSLARTAMQRSMYSATPNSNFAADFRASFAQAKALMQDGEQEQAELALSQTLGQTQMESAERRALGVAAEFQFAALLDKAYAGNALDNPQAFLKSLSAGEMEQLRVQHGLADEIQIDGLSREGASNLLLPNGFSLDLNADGFEEVGLARTGHFPPRDAPDSFKTAWFAATEKMDEGQVMDYAFMMHTAVYGFGMGDAPAAPVNPVDQMSTYRDFVDNYLAAIKQSHGYMAPGQYERDNEFFERLAGLMHA
ncbi:hypothetical protein [Roseateles oligotrophus]|uniref:Uncharacterized protein n=1 Tax=Roseateles oligotrophus TaxID=1769250 RepID=A0ABT2YL53_9BURK|nr:hypothetical protein [Roseateles oligotrophus]MCV2370784.1 hypothetical protein [Roseateles oligotrophus]